MNALPESSKNFLFAKTLISARLISHNGDRYMGIQPSCSGSRGSFSLALARTSGILQLRDGQAMRF